MQQAGPSDSSQALALQSSLSPSRHESIIVTLSPGEHMDTDAEMADQWTHQSTDGYGFTVSNHPDEEMVDASTQEQTRYAIADQDICSTDDEELIDNVQRRYRSIELHMQARTKADLFHGGMSRGRILDAIPPWLCVGDTLPARLEDWTDSEHRAVAAARKVEKAVDIDEDELTSLILVAGGNRDEVETPAEPTGQQCEAWSLLARHHARLWSDSLQPLDMAEYNLYLRVQNLLTSWPSSWKPDPPARPVARQDLHKIPWAHYLVKVLKGSRAATPWQIAARLRGCNGPVRTLPSHDHVIHPMSLILDMAISLGQSAQLTADNFLHSVMHANSLEYLFDGKDGFDVSQFQESLSQEDWPLTLQSFVTRSKASAKAQDRTNYEESFDWNTLQQQADAPVVIPRYPKKNARDRVNALVNEYILAVRPRQSQNVSSYAVSIEKKYLQSLDLLRRNECFALIIIGSAELRKCLTNTKTIRDDILTWGKFLEPQIRHAIDIGEMLTTCHTKLPDILQERCLSRLRQAGYPNAELQHGANPFGCHWESGSDFYGMLSREGFRASTSSEREEVISGLVLRFTRGVDMALLIRTGWLGTSCEAIDSGRHMNSAPITDIMFFPHSQTGELLPIIVSWRSIKPGGLVMMIPGTLHTETARRPAPDAANIFMTEHGSYLEAHGGAASGLRRSAAMAEALRFTLDQNVDVVIDLVRDDEHLNRANLVFLVFARRPIGPFTPIVWRERRHRMFKFY